MSVKIEDSTVELIDSMGSDLSVCNAARVSFHKKSEWEEEGPWIKKTNEDGTHEFSTPRLAEPDQKLIRYLAKHGHWSPFAHAFLSFRVKADFATVAQLFKHQVGLAANSVSRRYVSDLPGVFLPETWRSRPENVKQGSSETDIVTVTLEQYANAGGLPFQEPTLNNLVTQHYGRCLALYENMLAMGVAPEQARWVLPIGAMTEFIWSGSLMAFARVYKQRSDLHAQKEIRDVAHKISSLIPHNMQHSWAALTEN
jgi:thymidylate synthase (FAD)